MPDSKSSKDRRPSWRPGAVRDAILATYQKLVEHALAAPPVAFFEVLAERAEEIADDAIAEAINATSDTDVVTNIRVVRRLLCDVCSEIFLATEEADDVTISYLSAYLCLEGTDGYGNVMYEPAWGAHQDPEWGTIWAIRQRIRDFTPALIFKICMKGDVRFLGVECNAPTGGLPDEKVARPGTRTIIVSGIPVLAFSATEIVAAPSACAAEVGNALAVLAQELLALHKIEFPLKDNFDPMS